MPSRLDDTSDDLLEIAEAIDKDDREVTDWEASFLETVLPLLRAKKSLSQKQAATLRKMRDRYLDQ